MQQLNNCPLCGSEDITVGEIRERFLSSASPENPNLVSITEQQFSCENCGRTGWTTINSPAEQHVISAN